MFFCVFFVFLFRLFFGFLLYLLYFVVLFHLCFAGYPGFLGFQLVFLSKTGFDNSTNKNFELEKQNTICSIITHVTEVPNFDKFKAGII